jgi:uncharacterized protein (DUF169 family)
MRLFAARLAAALKPVAPPIGIAFVRDAQPTLPPPFEARVPPPNEAGRTGAVPAGCVFWMKATERAFSTSAADHANCSVGSYTHGFLALEEAVTRDDVAAVLASGWVDHEAMASLPTVRERPARVVYGPLAEFAVVPDVVLLRINGLGLMTLKNALPAAKDSEPRRIYEVGRGDAEDRHDDQLAVLPPSTLRICPVMNEASSDAMKTIACACSSERPRRPIGTVVTRAAFFSGVPVKRVNMPVSTGPGATAFTRIPDWAVSSATDLVMPSTACLLPT